MSSSSPPPDIQMQQFPNDILKIIIRYLYESRKSIVRLSLASKSLLSSTFATLDYLKISKVDLPVEYFASATPSHVEVEYDAEGDESASTLQPIIAKLLSRATSANIILLRPEEAFKGCLQQVKELELIDAHTAESLHPVLFGESEANKVAPHPLRTLICHSVSEGTFWRAFDTNKFPYLTELSSYEPPLVNLQDFTSLRRITWIQSLHRCVGVSWKRFPVKRLTTLFDSSVEFINQLKFSLPSQLATDMNGCFYTDPNGLTFPMAALPFLIASSVSDVDVALRDCESIDVQATLFALAANHLDDCFNQDATPDDDVASTPVWTNLQRHKFQKLLDRGADLFASVCISHFEERPVHTTVFHIAVSLGYPSTVEALYSFVTPADVDRIRDQHGFSPLHYPAISATAWKECFDWHYSNVPNWQLTDAANAYHATPVSRLLSKSDKSFSNILQLLDHCLARQPTVFSSQLNEESLKCILKCLSNHWWDVDLARHSDHLPRLIRVVEKHLAGLSAMSFGADDPEVLAFLLHNSPGLFRGVIKGFPGTLLVDALIKDRRPSPSVIDRFFDALKHNCMENIPLVDSEGEKLINTLAYHATFESLSRLLFEYSVDPVCNQDNGNYRVIYVITSLSVPETRCKSSLARLYWKWNRPDLALLVLECIMTAILRLSGYMKRKIPSLNRFEMHCSALFDDREFVQFLRDPVLHKDDNASKDLTATILFILLSPVDLKPLSAELHASLLKHLVTRMVVNSHYSFSTTIGNLIFLPALLTMHGGDTSCRQELVMSVLPQLVELFEKAPIEARIISTSFNNAAHCLDHMAKSNSQANALFQRVSAAIVPNVSNSNANNSFSTVPVFIPL